MVMLPTSQARCSVFPGGFVYFLFAGGRALAFLKSFFSAEARARLDILLTMYKTVSITGKG